MSTDPKLKVELDGDATGLNAAISKASHSLEKFAKDGEKHLEHMNSPFEKLSGSFSMIKEAIAGLVVVEFMKESIEHAVELGSEIRRLSSYFSISAEHAGELAEALKRMKSSPEEFINMADKMLKQVRKNKEGFEAYGIEVTKVNSKGVTVWRDQTEILEEAGKKLNTIEDNTARNIAAQELFGKGGKEAALYFMKLDAASKASAENMERMGVALDYKKLAADSKAFAKTQADITQQMDILKVVAGVELLPAVKDLATFFGSVLGPIAVGTAWIIKGLTSAFWALKWGIESGVAYITDFVMKVGNGIAGIGKMLSAIIQGNYREAAQIFKETNDEHIRIDKETKQILEDVEEDHWKKQESIWEKHHSKSDEKELDKDGGKITTKDDREKDQKIIDGIKNLLEEKRKLRAAELGIDEDYFQLSAADTLAFWKHQETIVRESEKANAFVRQESKTAKIANLKETEAKWKAELEKGLAAEKNNYDEQITLAEIYLGRIETYHTKESKEYMDAEKKLQELKNQKQEAEKKYQEEVSNGQIQHQTALLDIELEYVAVSKNLKFISEEQALRETIRINEKKYQVEKQLLQDRLKLAHLEPAERQKIVNQIQAIDDKHKKDQIKQNEQLYLQMRKKNPMAGVRDGAKDYVKAAKDHFTNFKNAAVSVLNAAENGIANALKGMLTGQMSFGEAMKGIWTGITDAVISAISKLVAQWVVAAAAEAIFGAETETVENAKAGAALDTASAETWAAYAGIPFVGPALALAQQALILTSYAGAKAANKAATAFATGGMVTGPTLGLVGEAGPEIMAPKEDFMEVTKSLVASGASIYQSIVETQAKTNKYAAGSNYTPSQAQMQNVNKGVTVNVHNAVVGDKKALGDFLKNTINTHTRTYGSAI